MGKLIINNSSIVNDEFVSMIIKQLKRYDINLFEYKFSFLSDFFGNNDAIKVYKLESGFIKEFEKHISKINHNIINKENSTTILTNFSIYFILKEWIGLKDLTIILNDLFSENLEAQELIKLMKFEIDRYLISFNSDLQQVRNIYKDCIISKNGFIINQTIIPKFIVFKEQMFEIPEDDKYPITNIFINVTPDMQLTSVRIMGSHPNCDNDGWYCIGNMKNRRVDENLISEIIHSLEIYKLDDCYWYPPTFNRKNLELTYS